MKNTYNIIIYKDEETGLYWAECPALKGCYTQGVTIEEVKENMVEAIGLYLEDYSPGFFMEDSVTLSVAHA
jgi:predicted RNase H-like HicB family nuclease